ncbi:unnamed protein product [Prorocentrum cordatum]|uniref:Uncharacterized protein n=1 Tax=Prorocentrum cordatum TaxID=2364126 RepID=A0ABN9VNT3_9DINO|nr:unnamed protein product [Polarella glacialis]
MCLHPSAGVDLLGRSTPGGAFPVLNTNYPQTRKRSGRSPGMTIGRHVDEVVVKRARSLARGMVAERMEPRAIERATERAEGWQRLRLLRRPHSSSGEAQRAA